LTAAGSPSPGDRTGCTEFTSGGKSYSSSISAAPWRCLRRRQCISARWGRSWAGRWPLKPPRSAAACWSMWRQLKERPLEKLINLHQYRFSVRPGDLEAASLEPFGLWRRLTYRKDKQTGYSRFQHRSHGRFTVEFPTIEEIRKAVDWLPAALGEVL